MLNNQIKFLPNYKIKTQDGFEDFMGVSYNGEQKVVTVYFDDESFLTCTPDHKIFTSLEPKEAGTLKYGDLVQTGDLLKFKKVLYVERGKNPEAVFDVVAVNNKDHNFITNNTLAHNCLVLDEFAHILPNIAEEFYKSVYPTIASGKTTKIIIVSTPNGMNLFYKLWTDAENKRNRFIPYTIDWRDRPGYDQTWYEDTMANMDLESFQQEFESLYKDSLINIYDEQTQTCSDITIGKLYDALQTTTSE